MYNKPWSNFSMDTIHMVSNKLCKIKEFRRDYRFLSNFYLSPVLLDFIDYPSVEHAYQAAKCKDVFERKKFLTGTPGQAKKLGQRVVLRNNWEEMKIPMMSSLVRQKFLRNEDLKDKLLATGKAELEEGNTWGDTFWGVYKGKGENWLGRILMEVREELNALRTK